MISGSVNENNLDFNLKKYKRSVLFCFVSLIDAFCLLAIGGVAGLEAGWWNRWHRELIEVVVRSHTAHRVKVHV